MSKQTSLTSFLQPKTPPKNTSYLAQLRDELGGGAKTPITNKPVFESKKRKSLSPSMTIEKKKKTVSTVDF